MNLLRENPVLALFLCLGLGYLLGKLRVGPIQLGGICGTLIVSLLIGSRHVTISGDVKTVAFALFIFSLGYMGGPQFFANLNAKGARFGVLCLVEFVTVIGIAFGLAKAFALDVGTASGILAGAATESAVVGTAQESIAKLNLPADQSSVLQNNVATAYSVCYLFGLVTIVLLTSQIMPMLMRIDLKDACREIWDRMRGDDPSLEPDEQAAMPALVGRTYQVVQGDGQTVAEIEAALDLRASVEGVKRGTKLLDPAPDLALLLGDLVLVVGERGGAIRAGRELGPEAAAVPGLDTPLAVRDVVVTNKAIVGKNVGKLEHEHPDLVDGVYLTDLLRVDHHLPVVRETEVHRGDVLTLVGPRARLNRLADKIGDAARNDATDYVYLALGIALGVLIGTISVKIGGIPLTLGTGGGCLISGLVFGWARARRPTFGAFPVAAAQTIKDLGLSIFIAVTGLTAGADAWSLIKQYGALLPLAGIGMVLIPAVFSLIVGLFVLKIEKPILIGAIAGQQCSTPAITSITQVAASTVPLLGYTITYTISNFLLPLSGPLLVGFLGSSPGH
jgi:putative transport protein